MTNGASTPLYLSRLFLNPRSRQVMSELSYPYEMHRTLMRAFPKATHDTKRKARDEFGILFRTEPDDMYGVTKVCVQSVNEPNWSLLHGLDDYLFTNTGVSGYEYKDIMPVLSKIQNGQVFSFRLRANPTKRVAKRDDPMQGKRVELRRESEQINWLIRKGEAMGEGVAGGFELLKREIKDLSGTTRMVPMVRVCSEGIKAGRKHDAGRDRDMNHWAVLFDGLLRVTDKNAFMGTLIRGIGSGKAFGFGLLSIAATKPDILR
jgi:CRISPR system Cascade subunit CasE